CGILMMPVFSSHSRRASCSFAGRKVRRFLLKHQNFLLFFFSDLLFISRTVPLASLSLEADAKVRTFSLLAIKKKKFIFCLFSPLLPSEAGCKGTKSFALCNAAKEVFSSSPPFLFFT
ncbi:hypothetical protein, partial [Pontibacter brevis]